MLSARAELTARYSHLVPLRGADATFLAADEVGAGLSYYLRGHDLKVQGDWFRVTDPLLGRWAQQVRLQFQLFF